MSERIVDQHTFRERLQRLEQWLWGDGFPDLGLGAAPPADEALADRVLELSDLYTLRREHLAPDSVRSSHLLARTLYFLCADAPKVHLILAELAERRAWSIPERLVVTDVGSGVGATAIGLILSASAGTRLELHAIDSDPACLDAWHVIVRAAGTIADVSVEATSSCGSLSTTPGSDAGVPATHLTLCQATLNELLPASAHPDPDAVHDGATVEMVRGWCARGAVILIEPALRIATRPLQRLRDELVRDGSVRVLAPCPHQRDCPMLAVARDWCHEVRRWRPTPRVDAIQRLTRRRDERLKYSFMAFAPADLSGRAGDEAAMAPDARLVSDPLVTKGKTERVVCLADGTLRKLRVLDKERTAANAALAELTRGSLVSIDGLSDSDRVGSHVHVAPCEAPSA